MELQLACMLDSTALLAITDGAVVPNVEDFSMTEKLGPSRFSKVAAFEAW